MMVSAPSTPAPRTVTAPPKSLCRFSTADSGLKSVVLPANVAPSIGVMCHSAAAIRGAPSRHTAMAARSLRTCRQILDRKAEEQRSEDRARHVPSLQLEGAAQPVAVREED